MRGELPGVPQASSSSSMSVTAPLQSAKPSRRRTPKTCGECRRLKLKCDRVFPCQSCVKRGCEGICPEGSLVSGRGSRYILANTEQLHEKNVRMSERIRNLEEALKAISQEHARCLNLDLTSGPAHPLLREDLLLIRNQLELYGSERSQLVLRSDNSYSRDGSDGEPPRLGSEQSLPSPSPVEAFMLNPAASTFLESQLTQYATDENLDPISQLFSDIKMTENAWPPSPQGFYPYQNETRRINFDGPPYPLYAINAMPSAGHRSRNYQPSRHSLPINHSVPETNAQYTSDTGQYLSPSQYVPGGNQAADQFSNIWSFEGHSQ